ncbi:hypothetical protein PVK06_005835 [Gossypium arboreum]|uniref:Uncharacterized protein n=1 Tax=Gossypium arboreum TaxID=29729 RepID=A0ABR0QVT3_GOSAR|nr:hypothetical protein PVK06_005835 [Gossypium arboreum]
MPNLAKCINSVLKGTRHLSIASVVKKTYFHLADLFPKWAAVYARQIVSNHIFYEDVIKEIRQNTTRENTMYVVSHSCQNLEFRVTEHARHDQDMLGTSYRVKLT